MFFTTREIHEPIVGCFSRRFFKVATLLSTRTNEQIEKEKFVLIDEFYTFDLVEIYVERICRKINLDLEFQSQKIFSPCILLITKVKFSKEP